MKKYTKTLSILAVTAASVSTVSAGTIFTWTGAAGSGTIWNDAGQWDGNGAPREAGELPHGVKLGTADGADIIIFDSQTATGNYMPTTEFELERNSNSVRAPNIDLRNGTLNFSKGNNRGFGTTYTIGDGDLTNSALFHMIAQINLNQDGSSLKTYVVNADGTLSFGANFTWSSNDAVVQLLGGALNTNGNTISGMTDDSGEYVSFDAAGSTFTAGFGGSFANEAAVTAAFDDSFRLGGALASNGSTLSYADNGNGSFTVSAVPEPSTTALLGLGGLALILRRRR